MSTRLKARESPIATDTPALPPTDPATEAAPAMLFIVDESFATRVILFALIPVAPSPFIKDRTSVAILFSAYTPAPLIATPALPPPARATAPAITMESMLWVDTASAVISPVA